MPASQPAPSSSPAVDEPAQEAGQPSAADSAPASFAPAEPDIPDAAPTSWLVERAAAEYGRFRAKSNLHVDGILAFTTGATVNATHPRLVAGPWGPGWLADDVVEDTQPGEPIPGQPLPGPAAE